MKLALYKYTIACLFMCNMYSSVQGQSGMLPAGQNFCENGQWILTWSDEFSGNSVDNTKWVTYSNDGDCYTQGNDDCPGSRNDRNIVMFKDDNVVVSNGTCKMFLKEEQCSWKGTNFNFSGAYLATPNFQNNRLLFKRGKVVARIKMCGTHNSWNAFWLWGAGKWEETSEIDIVEYYGNKPKRATFSLHNFPHHLYEDFTRWTEKGGTNKKINWSHDWHDYMVEWDENFIRFYIDGHHIETQTRFNYVTSPGNTSPWNSCTSTPGEYWNKPGFFDINEHAQIIFDLTLQEAKMFTSSCTMEIDWVRVFQRDGCQENYNMVNSFLFANEELSKKTITLGTQGNSNITWYNIVPQWTTGHYEAEAITILPNFESYPVWRDPTPSNTNDPNPLPYSSFLYEARECPGYASPPVVYEPPVYDEDAILADTLVSGCVDIDTIYLDSLINVAIANNDTALLNEIQDYLAELECDWWPVLNGNKPGRKSDDNPAIQYRTVKNQAFIGRIRIYPNPTIGTFNIEMPQRGNYTIRVMNMLGSTVYEGKMTDGQKKSIQLGNNLPSGNYTLHISGDGLRHVERITLTK